MDANQTPARVMSVVWTTMGAACLLFPKPVLQLSLHPRLLEGGAGTADVPRFLMRCFGAQACVAGLLLGTTTFSKRTYLAFGAAMLPFFAFNVLAYRGKYLTAFGTLGDAAGNAVFVMASACGAGLLRFGRQQ